MKKKIIIDCDPGVDDALAIFLALASSDEIEVIGLTCVKGNVALDLTYANAQRILAAAGRLDIPVHRGIARPIMSPVGISTDVHGKDGLGDIGLPAPSGPQSTTATAVDFMIDHINAAPGEITLCPIGPMTNIAVALLLDPSIAQKLHSIVFMGGAAFCPGNMNAHAEFNFIVDPHAAQIVLQCGAPLVMFGLDVTHQARISPDHIAQMRAMGKTCGTVSAQLLSAYAVGDLHLHDPCVIAYLIASELFEGVSAQVHVVTDAGPEFGRSVAVRADAGNCLVMTKLLKKPLFDLLQSRLRRLP
jgi:purine nucleosidase